MIRRPAVLGVLAVVLGVRPGRADPPAPGDMATANALFVEGRRLSADGRVAEACARFAASMALVPRLGVELNLADCYERLRRTASAWVAFGEAAALARRLADPREAFARKRQAALVPRLSYLAITLPGGPSDGLVVERDGARVDPSAYGVNVPVDPGAHVVAVAAPDRVPWSKRVVVAEDGEVVTVAVPELAPRPAIRTAPAATAVSTAPAAAPRRATSATWIAAGASLAALGAGTALGISARSLWQEASAGCDASHACSDAAYAVAERGRRDGNLATAAFALGGAALVTSVVLYLRSGGRDRIVRVVPAPGGTGVAVVGRF
jgi:hypothetical protein